uniref:Uncharacterized protein n=1 Tax=Rhizophora mucronata TaxID=61149 RepID=A0A2P2NAI8_RHIMU
MFDCMLNFLNLPFHSVDLPRQLVCVFIACSFCKIVI